VLITDIREDLLAALEEELPASGASVVAQRDDVTMEDEWQDTVDAAVESFGKLDILVNSAES
jgi:NADP-dependent 3-hydroxy acid dehydrogenase YdfG